MTFESRALICPVCMTGRMLAELDQGNNLWLVCQDDGCGTRGPATTITRKAAERAARESNRLPVGGLPESELMARKAGGPAEEQTE